MDFSNNGLLMLKEFEGLRLHSYQCQAGVWTIGYGHTKGVKPGQTITEQQASNYLLSDIENVVTALNQKNYKLTQNQFDALVSFFYNLGTGRIKDFNAVLSINPNDESVTTRMNKYILAGGKISNGLIARRKTETILYNS